MINVVRDLERLEDMLTGIENPGFRGKFAGLVEKTYLDIYEDLDDEDKFLVDVDVRSFELSNDGWELVEDVMEPGGWLCKVYQHNWWGHWRVEVWGKLVRMPNWDDQFETEAEAKSYARRVASSRNRPWG